MDFNELFNERHFPFSSDFQEFTFLPTHQRLSEEMRKRLYCGGEPQAPLDAMSGPVTDIAVELFQTSAPSPIRKLHKQYAADVAREACISPYAMMLALVYIERLKRRNPEYLQQISSSDLFLISMMVASKYLYDEGEEEEVFNDEWGAAGNLDVQTVNDLELNFLSAIDWSLFTEPSEFFNILNRVETSVAQRQGMKRGWFTYTDLCVLLEQANWRQALLAIYQHFTKVTCLLGLLYLTSVAGLIAAATVLHHASRAPLSPALFDPTSSGPDLRSHTLTPSSPLRCCVPTNGSHPQPPSVTPDLRPHQGTASLASLRYSAILSLTSSFFSIIPAPQDCADPPHLPIFPHTQCRARNHSSSRAPTWYTRLTTPWFSPFLLSQGPLLPEPLLSPVATFQKRPCSPESALPFGKSPDLLMPG